MIEEHFRSLKWFIYWIPAIAWMGMIFFFSSLSEPMPGVDQARVNALGKAAHVFEYAGLCFWIFFGFIKGYQYPGNIERSKLWIAVFGSLLYAFTDEIHQLFVPGRTFRILDLGYDALGAVMAIAVIWFLRKKSFATEDGNADWVTGRGGEAKWSCAKENGKDSETQ